MQRGLLANGIAGMCSTSGQRTRMRGLHCACSLRSSAGGPAPQTLTRVEVACVLCATQPPTHVTRPWHPPGHTQHTHQVVFHPRGWLPQVARRRQLAVGALIKPPCAKLAGREVALRRFGGWGGRVTVFLVQCVCVCVCRRESHHTRQPLPCPAPPSRRPAPPHSPATSLPCPSPPLLYSSRTSNPPASRPTQPLPCPPRLFPRPAPAIHSPPSRNHCRRCSEGGSRAPALCRRAAGTSAAGVQSVTME